MSTTLQELEIKLAFLENTVEQLSEELATQQRQVAMMERVNKELIARVQGLQEGSNSSAENNQNGGIIEDKPPHY